MNPEDKIIRDLLIVLGEDPDRDGLKETPKRVMNALFEMVSGYGEDPAEHLKKQFDSPMDQMIILPGIEFSSLCEHHLLPFFGTVDIGYIPRNKVAGASKFARMVDGFARRLQIQERLTSQIANAIETTLNPFGCGVVINAHHTCMGSRGIHQPRAQMKTITLRGNFRTGEAVRHEFLGAIPPQHAAYRPF